MNLPLGPYPTYVKQNGSDRIVPIVQAFYYSKYLGHLELHFDENGELKLPVDGVGVKVCSTIYFTDLGKLDLLIVVQF